MNKIKQIIFLFAGLLFLGGCDKDFVEINTDPYAINTLEQLDPALLFAGAQRVGTQGGYESENTIVQHHVNPFNDGATLAFNFNEDIDGFQGGPWNLYTGPIKAYSHILAELEGTTTQVNLQSMTRIMRAYVFMNIVDHHGDVPYFNAGQAALKGEEYWFPAYDDDAAIYEDLYKELKEAIANLNPTGDFVSADLFYGTNSPYKINSTAAQVDKWKKFGNSLLLRLGLRYTKVDPVKAAAIANEAFTGGVMTSNADNAYVVYDGTLFTNNSNNNLINNNPRFYYAAEPFVNQLKNTSDPRSKYIIARYANPNAPLNDPNPNTNVAEQFGLPVGVLATTLANPPYRGRKGSGYDYSQFNVTAGSSLKTPTFWLTYSQTALLVADAAKRGWIPGGDAVAQTNYENAINADMDLYSTIIKSATATTLPVITEAEKAAYLAHPLVAYNPATALNLINTAYWVVNVRDGSEAWANHRRTQTAANPTGYPSLQRNTFNNNLLANGGDGYVHRFSYPDAELSRNKVNYFAAVESIGGTDDLITRVFWDVR